MQIVAGGQALVERRGFGQHAGLLADFAALRRGIQPQHAGAAGGGREHAVDQPDERGFARAIVTEHAEDFARFDAEAQAVERADARPKVRVSPSTAIAALIYASGR